MINIRIDIRSSKKIQYFNTLLNNEDFVYTALFRSCALLKNGFIYIKKTKVWVRYLRLWFWFCGSDSVFFFTNKSVGTDTG